MPRGKIDESQMEALKETEGIVVGIYKHLWMKNHKGLSCEVNIPHTVVYQDSEPIAWYFTSNKEQKIMRKKKENVTGQQIAEAFMKKADTTSPVSGWFNGRMTPVAMGPRRKPSPWAEPDEGSLLDLRLEHLTFERTQTLLDPGQYRVVPEELYDGVLQKFVEPREAFDHIIRAIWTPTACIYEKRMNRHPLSSESEPDMSKRVATFSPNNTYLNKHCPLAGGALTKQLEAQAEAIAAHLREVTDGRATPLRMQLFFKIDRNNKIWFLFCDSLQLDPGAKPMTLRLEPLAQPKTVLRDPGRPPEEEAPREDAKEFMCALTGEMHPGDRKIEVTYKLLIQHWFMEASTLVNETDRIHAIDTLPPALRRANPNLSREHYLRHRASPSFLLNTAAVCPEAAAKLSRAALEDLAGTLSRPNIAMATGRDATLGVRNIQSARKATAHQRPAGAVLVRPMSSPGSTRRPPTARAQGNGAYSTLPSMLQPKVHDAEEPGISPRTQDSASPAGSAQHGGRVTTPQHVSSRVSPTRTTPYVHPSNHQTTTATPTQHGDFNSDYAGDNGGGPYYQDPAQGPGGPAPARGSSPGGRSSPSRLSAASYPPKAPHLSVEEMRTLRELSEAYSQAEAVTQALLAEAQDVLQQSPTSQRGRRAASPVPPPSATNLPQLQRTPSYGASAGGTAGNGSSRPFSAVRRTSGNNAAPQVSSGSFSGKPPSRAPSATGSKPGSRVMSATAGSRVPSSSGPPPAPGLLPRVPSASSRQPSTSSAAAGAAGEQVPPAEALTNDEAELLAEALTED